MKTYLNKKERDACLVIGAFVSWMRKQADDWVMLNRSKTLIKFMRMAASLGDKALQEILAPLDQYERARVVAESIKMRVSTRYSDAAVREYKEILSLDNVTAVRKDELEDMLECVFDCNCKGCTKTGNEADHCIWKIRLLNFDIEPFNLEACQGSCPYYIEKEDA